ncbi:MAG TPA: hypothetical protein VN026_18350 [Bacteroidia bacterium]|jgi:hypothetical protein|nr:hypothetical protein [Bacteroidia bacterium]
MLHYQTGQLLVPTETNINEKVQYTANTGMALLATGNSALDGSGTVYTVLTAASNGTRIARVTIQGRGTTTRGMIRFFIGDNSTFTRIIDEVDVPARIQSGTQDCWSITYDTDWCLKSGYILVATTENTENFCVIAEGLDYAYPALNGI